LNFGLTDHSLSIRGEIRQSKIVIIIEIELRASILVRIIYIFKIILVSFKLIVSTKNYEPHYIVGPKDSTLFLHGLKPYIIMLSKKQRPYQLS